PKAEYQAQRTGSGETQYDMLRRLELDEAAHLRLVAECRNYAIEFLSTAFDEDSVDLLVRLGVGRMKVPSGEITNGPLLLRMARTGLPVIMSTGMSTLDEIADALAVFAWVADHPEPPPSLAVLRAAFADGGREALRGRVYLLHCTTAYPAPPESINLKAMDTLAKGFGLPVGFSDHSVGITLPLAAVARGAVVIEKHFTLDRTLPGPDHAASVEPEELAAMVAGIRMIERALGDGQKGPTVAEAANVAVARRGLVASRPIAAGQQVLPQDIAVLRPALGACPMEYWDYVGQPAPQACAAGAPILWRKR
ncbi:MAG: N-acetylneuraminate synthase family protein, partial [Alphaproteobacteria bacterium]|nr:N-acetylneuraminate synthase family protein [Alphaproteobacteria bacterium]